MILLPSLSAAVAFKSRWYSVFILKLSPAHKALYFLGVSSAIGQLVLKLKDETSEKSQPRLALADFSSLDAWIEAVSVRGEALFLDIFQVAPTPALRISRPSSHSTDALVISISFSYHLPYRRMLAKVYFIISCHGVGIDASATIVKWDDMLPRPLSP